MNWSDHVGKGWRLIVDKAVAELQSSGAIILQVKEKFGGLRIYYGSITNNNQAKLETIVRAAEAEAAKTCEGCGKPGTGKVINGWVKTVCPEHENGFKYE